MGKIQELTEQLANQIAAGEVVERPASVIKELVENAIDAGATQIDIMIEEAGLKTIQVTDNGEGIASEDVLAAFKRHATSKIHTRDDLFRIRTLGFRGEALPSIASVSEIRLETAVVGEEAGSLLVLKGGRVEEHSPAKLRQGTQLTVSNLFYNTPARLKYVKTIQTELANIGDIVNRLALSHPNIAFRLAHDGNRMMSTTGNGDLKTAIAGIYGVSTAKKMLEIKAEDLDFTLKGYVTLPEVTRASRNYLSVIINGRYIKNFALNKAIVAGYGSKLMVGRFPIAVIEIDMDPLLVDVNVHPTKQEVRLSKEKELMGLITSAIQQALASEQLIPSAVENLKFKKKVDWQHTPKSEQTVLGFSQPKSTNPERFESMERIEPTEHLKKTSDLAFDRMTGDFFVKEEVEEFVVETPTHEELAPVETPKEEEIYEEYEQTQHPDFNWSDSAEAKKELNRVMTSLEREEVPEERFPELEYFGQMHGTYLFAQSDTGLFIIDQHAAQERIKYEYFREEIGKVGDDLQELLLPIILDYPTNDVLTIKENEELLHQVGIYLEPYGQNSFILRYHPTWYPQGEEESIVREMIDMLLSTGNVSVKKFREATAIMMSCKRSIKANHYLNDSQARVLLEDLAKCSNPFNCPHGRPVLIHFTNKDMEKMFKRIQDPHISYGQ
ncbi:MAG: DNA mismatch repair endonuclease MutL [Lactobacillales bacterium]|nr:DNA mismatch repair endonuclease MutL [Lactobacillales bacterium]